MLGCLRARKERCFVIGRFLGFIVVRRRVLEFSGRIYHFGLSYADRDLQECLLFLVGFVGKEKLRSIENEIDEFLNELIFSSHPSVEFNSIYQMKDDDT